MHLVQRVTIGERRYVGGSPVDAQARALGRRSSRSAARKAKATAATSRPSGGARGLWRWSRSLGKAHTHAASACTKPALLRPQAPRTRPASVVLAGVDVKQTVCQPTDTPRSRPPGQTDAKPARLFYCFLSPWSPAGGPAGASGRQLPPRSQRSRGPPRLHEVFLSKGRGGRSEAPL